MRNNVDKPTNSVTAPLVPKRLHSESLGTYQDFEVIRHEVAFEHSDEPRSEFPQKPDRFPVYCLQMPDWVTVVAVTEDERILLVRQYRHGADQVLLETPGGLVDDTESPHQAAARELREETGYQAQQIEPLGWVFPNPAIQTNRLHIFLATGVKRVGALRPDEHESIEPVLLDQQVVRRQLRQGQIRHCMSALALERAFKAPANSSIASP